jgi:hypothetical protein
MPGSSGARLRTTLAVGFSLAIAAETPIYGERRAVAQASRRDIFGIFRIGVPD